MAGSRGVLELCKVLGLARRRKYGGGDKGDRVRVRRVNLGPEDYKQTREWHKALQDLWQRSSRYWFYRSWSCVNGNLTMLLITILMVVLILSNFRISGVQMIDPKSCGWCDGDV